MSYLPANIMMVSHYGDPRDPGIGTLLTMDLTEMYSVCVLLRGIYFCAQGRLTCMDMIVRLTGMSF